MPWRVRVPTCCFRLGNSRQSRRTSTGTRRAALIRHIYPLLLLRPAHLRVTRWKMLKAIWLLVRGQSATADRSSAFAAPQRAQVFEVRGAQESRRVDAGCTPRSTKSLHRRVTAAWPLANIERLRCSMMNK